MNGFGGAGAFSDGKYNITNEFGGTLYGVEVKFCNMEVALDSNLETACKGLFVIGDSSGVTHSLSHASASGVYVARYLLQNGLGMQ